MPEVKNTQKKYNKKNVTKVSNNMNADVTKCGGIWRAFQLLETSANLQQHDAVACLTSFCFLASMCSKLFILRQVAIKV